MKNNIKLGYVTITLRNGYATAYIRDYDGDTLQARVTIAGSFVNVVWNGTCWTQVSK